MVFKRPLLSLSEQSATVALAAIGAAASLAVIAISTANEQLRQPPGRYVRWRSAFTLAYSILLFGLVYTTSDCLFQILYSLERMLETAIVSWQFFIVLDVLIIVRDPFKPDRHRRKFVVAVWLLFLLQLFSAVLFAVDHEGAGGCPFPSVDLLSANWIPMLYAIHIAAVAFVFAITLLLSLRLCTGLPISSRARHRVTRQLLTYAIGFSIADVAAIVVQLQPTLGPEGLLLISSRGLWDMMVWCVANLFFQLPAKAVSAAMAARRQMGPGGEKGLELARSDSAKRKDPEGAGISKEALRPLELTKLDVAEALRFELVLLTAHGIERCSDESWLDSLQENQRNLRAKMKLAPKVGLGGWLSMRSSRYSSKLREPRTEPRAAEEGRAEPQLVEEFSRASILRSAEASESQRERSSAAAAAVSSERASAAGQTAHVSFKGPSRIEMLRQSFASTLKRSDSFPSAKMTVRGRSHTGGHRPLLKVDTLKEREIDFFDYGAEEFARVRRCLTRNGGCERYSESFAGVSNRMKELDHRDKRVGFHEILSSGASGSFFYVTPDRRFIVKTVSKGEKDALIRMCESYAEHCEGNPDTLIQYLGCHSIRLPLNTRKIYFVVMRNVLPGRKLDATFDLKGATSNRQRVRGRDLAQLLAGARTPASFRTLLDKDWMALGMTLNLAADMRRELLATVVADAKFCLENRLIDYSLLLGASRVSEDAKGESDIATSGADGELYYIGLIDILEGWSNKWLVQEGVLKFFFRYVCCQKWYNPEGITAIPPHEYAARFVEFIEREVLRIEPTSDHLPGDEVGYRKSWYPFW